MPGLGSHQLHAHNPSILNNSRDSPGVCAYDIRLAVNIPERRGIVALEVKVYRLRPRLWIERILRLEDYLIHGLAAMIPQSVRGMPVGNLHYPSAMHHCPAYHHLQASSRARMSLNFYHI